MTTEVQPASTVVLLREASAGLEVLLVRRHRAIAFMGGAHVFPGGRVEAADCDARWLTLAEGIQSAQARMPDEAPAAVLGFCVAAMRETFEEAGVLLARTAAGRWVPQQDLATQRETASGSRLFELVQSRHWRLAIDGITYFAHWVTPAIESRRFDTRFFLAAAPADQIAVHDASEAVDSTWVRPADAIARCRNGELALPPPTWTTLRWLEPFQRVEAAMAWARAKPVPRIEPGFIQRDDTRIVTLPGDPTMTMVRGFEAQETRFLLSEGRWTPVAPDGDPS